QYYQGWYIRWGAKRVQLSADDMQPKYKHPTKGNPHGIVVRQHIHATRFIKKFAGPNGRVELFDKAASVPLRHAKPSDAIFCAYRRWDYKTESGLCVS